MTNVADHDFQRLATLATDGFEQLARAMEDLGRTLAETNAVLEDWRRQFGDRVRLRMAEQWGQKPVMWAIRCIARYERLPVWHPRVIGLWIRTQYDLID